MSSAGVSQSTNPGLALRRGEPGRVPDSDLELALMRLAWRIDSLDRWRKGVEQQLGGLSQKVDSVTRAQEIAEGVAEKLRETGVTVQPGGFGLTWWQKLGASIGGALVVADALRGLIS